MNLYAYTANNPVNFTDPSGNGPLGTLTGASVGAGIGGTAGALLGGVGGTFIEPGGGTIAGGITLGETGAAVGAGIGGYIGNQLENLFGNPGCPFFQSTSNQGGNSAGQPPKNPKDVGDLINKGTGASDLENKLTGAGWTSQPAAGGKNSGTGKIFTSPDGKSSIRIMTRPDGSSYARIYNGPSGGIESGEQPLNLQGKPGSKTDTHFNLPP